MPRLTRWLAIMALACSGCMGGSGGGGGEVSFACEVSNYCVMLSEFECSDRGGEADFDDSCSSLGYSCEDGDRFYDKDDTDCPSSSPNISDPSDPSDNEPPPDEQGACLTSVTDGERCATSTESSCSGTFEQGSCSDSSHPWTCGSAQYDNADACSQACSSACDYLGSSSDLEPGACAGSLSILDGCRDVLATDCAQTFTEGESCADHGFPWACGDGTNFEVQLYCDANCSGSCTNVRGSNPDAGVPDSGTPTDPDPYDGIPAGGGVIAVDVTNKTATTLDFEIDVFVIDDSGDLIANLNDGDLYFMDNTFDYEGDQDPFFTFTQTCFESMKTPDHGPYSAVMLMDQSGSISSTDPGDTRIDAAKIFFDALGPSDEAILAAFASGGSLSSDFVSWGDFGVPADYSATIDMLTSLEGGGTPLYDATVVYTNKVVAEANNTNKAVIIFTDGDDTASSETLSSAVSNANAQNVTLFTVGLSDGVDRGVLQQLAFQTGGSMMYTDDAADLVALYGTLGNLLSGGVSYYHTCWTVERDIQEFQDGYFTTSILVNKSSGGYATVPVYVEY